MRSPKYLKTIQALAASSVGFSFLFASALSAADVFKANNTNALNDAASWVGGVLPTANDRVIWDASVQQGGQLIELGASASWGSLKVENNVNELAIYDGSSLLSLTLGGLDMSAASSGTTFISFGPTLNATAKAHTWSIADGATFFSSAAPVLPNGATMNYNLGATGTGKFVWATGVVNQLIPYRFVNGTDFAAYVANPVTVLGSPQDNAVAVTAASTLGLSQANPSDGGVATTAAVQDVNLLPAAGRYIDVTNSNGLATATAFQLDATAYFTTNTGIRFNQPHATEGTNWVVGFGNNGRIQPGSPFTILVTPNVGARNVIFANGGGAHEFRFNSTTTKFNIQQNNTAGDLIWRGNISATNMNAGQTFTKGGAGRVIMANPDYGQTSSSIYITEGTLQLGEANATGTFGDRPIINNGNLVFNRSDAFTHAGVISGAGSLVASTVAGGTLTLSGANTYTGATSLNSGTFVLGNASALGASSALTLGGAAVRYGTGVSTDITNQRTVTMSAATTVDTNGNNVSWAGVVSGSGALTKSGAGSLTLGGANTYAGNTVVNSGELVVANTSASATGTGSVTIAGGAVLSGTGTISGAVGTAAGSKIVPGGVAEGTLTVGGLSLASGSLLDFQLTSTAAHDRVVVTGSNGLTINGGGIQLLNTASGDAYATAGTYNLIQYSGAVQGTGASALSVLNPQAGYSYTFGANGTAVTLQIVLDAILSKWQATGSGSWGAGGNWTNGIPTTDYTAQFTTSLASPATITLDGPRTVNGMVFDSAVGYTLAAGTGGSLTYFKSGSAAAINVLSGDHVISAPVSLGSSIAVTTEQATSLSITGAISGAGGITKAGVGELDLTAANTFTGAVNIVGGVLSFSQASGLGTGALTLNGGALAYNAGNTTDISTKVVTIGLDGAVIDTGGNDVTFANAIGNNGLGALGKSGAGSLTLLGANTYQGQTNVNGGELIISSNAALGPVATPSTLNLNGGFVVPSVSLSLDNAGANPRPVEVSAGGGGFLVANGLTLTVPGVIGGAGTLTKAGSGTLLITGNNSTRTGATNIESGVVNLGNNRAIGQTGLGGGAITFTGDASLYLNGVGTSDNGQSFGVLGNQVVVPAGVTAEIHNPMRGGYTGALRGEALVVDVGGVPTTTYPASHAGTVKLFMDGIRSEAPGQWPNFAGQLIVAKTPTGDGTDTDLYYMTGAQALGNAKVHFSAGVTATQSYNPPAGVTGTVHNFGELTADAGAILAGNPVAGRFTTYSVGSLNTNFTFNGQFSGSIGLWGNAFAALTKVGTGRMTLNGDHMMGGSAVNVNAGVLDVRGSIADFYTGIGADGIYGRPASGNSDDTISLTPPATDYVVTAPGALTVAAGATLAGNGTLGGAITVNGNLRPDETGSLGGSLKLTGSASLTLAATAVTQFDFGGTAFTGVQSTATGANTYGGELKLNFLGTVFNGNYPLFQLAVAPTGAFTTVTATSAATTTPVTLTDSGSGVWTGVIDGATLSFDAATGALSVTNGSTATLPSVPGALAANAGDGQVELSWNASTPGSPTYNVKRSTTQGGPYATIASNVGTTAYLDDAVVNGTTYYYVVEAKNAAGLSANSLEVSATPNVSVSYTALETWRFDQFGVYEDTDAVLAGDTEDFDGDGLANLLEYALGTNPKVANASPVVVGRSGNNLTLTYPKGAPVDANLTYTVKASSDLTTGFVNGTGATTGTGPFVYTDTVDVSAAGVRRFLRLEVTYTAPTP